MEHKIGLKLWSINIDYYYNEAIRLYNDKLFDYIELYIVPHTLHTLKEWVKLDIPFRLHAPHFMHEINLADPHKFEYNKAIFSEVEEFRKALGAEYTVIHAGMNNTIEETIRQINHINPINALIENKPFYAPLNEGFLCRGASFEEIEKIIKETKLGFCLDIGHAICTANSLNIEPYSYVEKFQNLKPKAYHLSGNFIDSDKDRHLHLYEGNYDYARLFSIIDTSMDIAIETNKDSKENLNDFKEDMLCLRKNLLP